MKHLQIVLASITAEFSFRFDAVALASAIVLLMVGNIPFLGVVIPNLVSLRYGDHMKNTLWLTGICGSLFLLICDILARVLIAPMKFLSAWLSEH